MACGCSGAKRQNVQYQYTSSNGDTQTVRTEIEAKALVIRNGGSYVAVPK